MNSRSKLLYASFAAVLLAACASGSPPAADFPAGAKAPSAAEITSLLKGKSFDYSPGGMRADYAKDGDAITVYFSGRSDVGTWRTEDGRVCVENFRTITGGCNDVRLVGSDVYLKRLSGQVVKLLPR